MIKKTAFNDLYKEKFTLVLTDSIMDVANKYDVEYNGTGGTMTQWDSTYMFVNPKAGMNVLVHECDHAVSFLWEERGINKIQGTDEAYSYMLAWLVEQFYPFYLKHKS